MDEEQKTRLRIAIAEACPKVFNIVQTTFDGPKVHWRLNDGCDGMRVDPLSDLNAMHEAEKVLVGTRLEFYESWLERFSDESDGYNWHATAAQRAEAFAKTLGLKY